MSIEYLTIFIFGFFLLMLAMGLPVVFSLGGIAVIATYFLWGPQAIHMMANRTFTGANSFVLLAIPMFIFMGCMLEKSGIARDLYAMMFKWMGPIKGGLAIGTVTICAIFAAMVGITGAATVSMGLVALPSMLKYKYDKQIAIGCISAGGALGVLIPPSVLMIILGLYTNTSIGALYAGGILPGIMLAIFFNIYIFIACLIKPEWGPALPPEERASWKEKFIALKAVILPIVLIVGILGSIFTGAATPSEAAALGAVGSMVCAAVYRSITLSNLREACQTTLRLSCMVMWIIFGASVFTALYTAIGAHDFTRQILSYLGGRWGIVIGMQVIWMIMGCFLDPNGIIMITAPIFFPLVTQLGFDPVWFGVLFVVNMEMGYLTPPFGFNLFYMQAIAPKGVVMTDIYKSVIPFVMIQFLGLALCMIFPEIILYLPKILVH
ncbi:MAG: tripartite transporter large subunit [Deltaproteobacteria bacterium]|jgi:tripartite ATP-independent transporter DctM subunit|nr:tripartite transporter large subunit [Deltaproteobacteria bacterium]